MTNAQMPVEKHEGEASNWLAPLYAFLQRLLRFFAHYDRLKRVRRTTRFHPDWRDEWPSLLQCEWLRDQVIVRGVRQILRGEELVLDDSNLDYDPPADYGDPCPATPFIMIRRYRALARWVLDPAACIRKRARAIAKREGIDLANPLLAHASTGAARAACNAPAGAATLQITNGPIALMVSSAHRARPSNHERVLTHARGPPACGAQSRAPPDYRLPTADCPESASFRERTRASALDLRLLRAILRP